MNIFQRFFASPASVSEEPSEEDGAQTQAPASVEPEEQAEHGLIDMKLVLGRGSHEVSHRASFDPESFTLTVERDPEDYEPTSYDLSRGELEVRVRKSYRNDDRILQIANREVPNTQEGFFHLDISQKSLIKYPAFREALKSTLLRSMFIHHSDVRVDLDTLATTMDSTVKYLPLRRIFSLELSDLYFEGVDAETILAHTTSTEQERKMKWGALDESGKLFTQATQDFSYRVNLGGEGRTFHTYAHLLRDSETKVPHGLAVKVTGGGVYIRYRTGLEGAPAPETMTPISMGGSGMDIADWWMREDFKMGDFPGDKSYARLIAANAAEKFLEFYRTAQPQFELGL